MIPFKLTHFHCQKVSKIRETNWWLSYCVVLMGVEAQNTITGWKIFQMDMF